MPARVPRSAASRMRKRVFAQPSGITEDVGAASSREDECLGWQRFRKLRLAMRPQPALEPRAKMNPYLCSTPSVDSFVDPRELDACERTRS